VTFLPPSSARHMRLIQRLAVTQTRQRIVGRPPATSELNIRNPAGAWPFAQPLQPNTSCCWWRGRSSGRMYRICIGVHLQLHQISVRSITQAFSYHRKASLVTMDFQTIDAWAAELHAALHYPRMEMQHPSHAKTLDALVALLKNEASPAEIARTITSTYQEIFAPDSQGLAWHEMIQHFWAFHMSRVIRGFGSATGRLVEMMVEISKQPDMKTADGTVVSLPGYPEKIYWRELPAFAGQFWVECLCSSLPSHHYLHCLYMF